MEADSAAEAAELLDSRLDELKASIVLGTAVKCDSGILDEITGDLCNVEAELQRFNLTIQLGNEECDRAEQLLESLMTERACLQHILEKTLPAYVKDHPPPAVPTIQNGGAPAKVGCNGARLSARAISSGGSANGAGAGGSSSALCLRPLSAEELAAVPGYIRGRVTCSQLAQFVTRFNSVLTARRQLFSSAGASLTSAQRKTLLACRRETLDETKGEIYVSESDFARFGNFRLGEPQRKMLMILRHCGQLRQVRGKDSIIHHVLKRT